MDHGKHGEHGNLLLEEETFRIRSAVFEVSRQMGTGFLEAVYQECLAIEFGLNEIPFAATPPIALTYKGQPLVQSYRPDFVCFDHVIVELKSVREIVGEHKAQVLNHLRATGLRVGLLVNFGSAPKARVERLVL